MPLGDEVGAGIHHFLLPSQGWGAVVDTAEAKTYAPDKREEVRLWRNGIRSNPNPAIKKRLAALAQRVEILWGFTLRRLTIAESEARRTIHIFGTDEPKHTPAITREQIEKVLHDENGAYRRLRRAMDAWCALWSWPLTTDIEPPDWDQWLGGLEAILGVPPRAGKFEKYGQTSLAGDLNWSELDVAEDTDRTFSQSLPIDKALDGFPWLTVAQAIVKTHGSLHWELDFAPVFARGGFDLQIGNPPWVRPDWDESGVLAEFDPWWQLTDKPAESVKRRKREETLARSGALGAFLDERARQAGMKENLGSAVDRPVLAGLQPDLYRCFMEHTWRSMAPDGVVGLVHPESHFTELRANNLRRETYRRLRRHWHFRNQLKLFSEISNTREYGLHTYGRAKKSPDFIQASNIFHPETVIRSLHHDGSGLAPGIKDYEGNWDRTAHRDRIVRVTGPVIQNWAALVDEPGTPPGEARMLYPVNRASAKVLDRIAVAPRLGDVGFEWTRGWEEDRDRKLGFFESASTVPERWEDVILQGPHLTVATSLSKQPNPTMTSQRDYTPVDFDAINEDFIPRTNYQIAKPYDEYIAAYPKWHGEPSSTYFRLAWRRMADTATVRTLHSAIVPPGPCFVGTVLSAELPTAADLAVANGIWASLPADFFIKAAGVSELKHGVIRRLPHVRNHPLEPQLLLRTLRLNCLVRPYAPLWSELYSVEWQHDSWVPHIGVDLSRARLGGVGPDWERTTPLRRAADRRQALVEIDAIVAIMLGVTAEELTTIYRTQFPVLQQYERAALYDSTGRQLPGKLASEYRKKGSLKPADLTVDGVTYVEPFVGVDRERDMELAHKHFSGLVD